MVSDRVKATAMIKNDVSLVEALEMLS